MAACSFCIIYEEGYMEKSRSYVIPYHLAITKHSPLILHTPLLLRTREHVYDSHSIPVVLTNSLRSFLLTAVVLFHLLLLFRFLFFISAPVGMPRDGSSGSVSVENISTVLEDFRFSSYPKIPVRSSSLADDLPYPLHPKRLVSRAQKDYSYLRTIHGARFPTPRRTQDRFIPLRKTSSDACSESFRLSKPPQHLSSTERLLRQTTASSDPFITRRVASNPIPQRTVTQRFRLEGYTVALEQRTVSVGAVWNVAGVVPAPSGPMVGVADGRGGLLGSGTNAPMFSSDFFRKESANQNLERYGARLAAALNIDQASRVLQFSSSSQHEERRSQTQYPSLGSWPSRDWADGGILFYGFRLYP